MPNILKWCDQCRKHHYQIVIDNGGTQHHTCNTYNLIREDIIKSQQTKVNKVFLEMEEFVNGRRKKTTR